MRFIGDIALDAEVRALASGAITDGAPVIVNSTGTVGAVATSTQTQNIGSNVVFESADTGYQDVTYDSVNDRIIISYNDAGNSSYGTAVVGTMDSSGGISFGTPVVFESATVYYTAINYDVGVGNGKVLIAYRDAGNSDYGTAIVGTIDSSDNSISFGTAVVFNSGESNWVESSYDLVASKHVITYNDVPAGGYTNAIVGTVSGTGVSFGSEATVKNASTSNQNVVYDSNSNRHVFAYSRGGAGYATVGTVSGTSLSFGSEAQFEAGAVNGNGKSVGITFDSNSNKVVLANRDTGNSNYGTAVVGTVSGTSISFGTPVVFSAVNATERISAGFDASVNKVIIGYFNPTTKNTFITGTVSGTSISFDSAVTFDDGSNAYMEIAFNSSVNRTVIAFTDYNNSNYGTALSLRVAGTTPSPLTTENFIGFAHAAYADGQKATVKTTGSIARNVPQQPVSATLGTEVLFHNSDNNDQTSIFIPDTNKILIAYKDEGNSSYGTVRVATIDPSDNSVSYGSEIVFNSGQTSSVVATYDTNSDRIVIGYANSNTSLTGKSIVGTVSGSSVSFGTAVDFNSKNSKITITFDSNSNKVVLCYSDGHNSNYGTAIVGTVDPSDNSISFGSEVVFLSASPGNVATCFDTNSNKVVLIYRDGSDGSKGTAIIGTVSGTSISFGSSVVFNAANTQQFDDSVVFDSSNNKVVIIYKDTGGSGNTEALVGTVSGTSISFGSLATVPDSDGGVQAATFDSDNNNIILAYQDDGDDGNVSIGTVSGTDISFNTPVEFASSAAISPRSIAYDPNTKRALITFADYDNSSHGFGIVYSPAGNADLTIGQQYFVQTDGTLGTSADSPSVIAGTAIGASDIIVKG